MKRSVVRKIHLSNATARLDRALDELTDLCGWFDPQPSELSEYDRRDIQAATPGVSGVAASIEQAATEIEVLNIRLGKALNGALSEKRLAKGKGYNLTKLLLTQLLSSTRTTATA